MLADAALARALQASRGPQKCHARMQKRHAFIPTASVGNLSAGSRMQVVSTRYLKVSYLDKKDIDP